MVGLLIEYVTPLMQGSGLGVRLLKSESKDFFSLGTQGPKKPVKFVCRNGWEAIPFQSSWCFIVSPNS